MSLSDQSTATLVAKIADLVPDLRPAERRVAEAVVDNPAMVARESISALAERCGVSPPTVVRFAKRAGFSGYPALRVGLAMAAGMEEARLGRNLLSGVISEDDSLGDVASKVASANARSVEDTVNSMDIPTLERAVDVLLGARRIDVVGIGSSSLSAADMVQKLIRYGMSAWHHSERHGAATALSLRDDGDVTIGFSHSGTTRDVLEPLQLAAAQGCTVIAVTGNSAAPLAKLADITLIYRSTEPTYRLGAMASRIAQLTVVDCLLAGMATKQPKRIRAAIDRTFQAVAEL